MNNRISGYSFTALVVTYVTGCYRSKNGCRFGNSCHFSHDEPNTRFAETSVPPLAATPDADEDEADAKPLVVEGAAGPAEDTSIDNSRAVVLYDPEIAEANLLKAILHVERKRKPGSELEMAQCSK